MTGRRVDEPQVDLRESDLPFARRSKALLAERLATELGELTDDQCVDPDDVQRRTDQLTFRLDA